MIGTIFQLKTRMLRHVQPFGTGHEAKEEQSLRVKPFTAH